MAQQAETFLLSRLSRASLAALILLAIAGGILGAPLLALVAALGAGVVACDRSVHRRQGGPWASLQQLLMVTFAALLLGTFLIGPWSMTHWLYLTPLALFALFRPPVAIPLTLLMTALMLAGNAWMEGHAERHQFGSAFLLTLLLSGVLMFLREYKSRQLAPLRRTDELTQAASREYLSADLHKEIQRSEREGTDLSLIMVGLDTHLGDQEPVEDIRSILPRVGRYLHSQIRDFDAYYRVADLQFLIILPGIATRDAAVRADIIRSGLRQLLESHGLTLTVSTGVAGLNIGDDADSLQHSAAHALRRAQQQGGNRSQTYSAWSRGPERPAPDASPGGPTP